MAKTSTLSQQSPLIFSTGQDVLADGLLGIEEIVEMLNFAFLNRSTECHLSLTVGPDDWDEFAGPSDGVGPLNIIFTGGLTTVIRAPIYFNSDQVAAGRTHLCGSRTFMQAGADAGTVDFTLTGNAGSVSAVNTHIVADNGSERTVNMTIATAQSIPGWAQLDIIIQQTGGISTDNELLTVRFQENPPASAVVIADPADD